VQLGATDSETAFIYAAGAVGMTTFGLLAGRIRSRYGFTKVAKWALIIESALFVVLGFMTNPWLAMVVFACMQGLSILFNVQTASLRQLITPNHMLGRVMTTAAVLAWSAIPVGSYLGGIAIEATGDPGLVYAALGGLSLLIPLFFFTFTALGHAERYIPADMKEVFPLKGDLESNRRAAS
jgi:MFS family permease